MATLRGKDLTLVSAVLFLPNFLFIFKIESHGTLAGLELTEIIYFNFCLSKVCKAL